jgi:hypothetical protein
MARPVIDRVYVGLRRAAGSGARALYERWGLRPGMESDCYFALLDHPVPAEAIEEATIYQGFDPAEEAARGVVVLEDDAWRLTGEGRRLALELSEVIGSASAELWSRGPIATVPGPERLERLCDLVGRCLEAGRAGGGPAFTGLTPVFEPEGADAASVLSSRLGALRHHRGDAHRAAWREAGYDVSALPSVGEGPSRRSIEEATDRGDEPMYSALSADERIELLAGLGALPDGLGA